ncbi:MAG: flagellar protein FliT [Betaproteobacteria bacterium HGW-Betaproteobacteria-21]|nr:MAG: flagellar protein FliT [Betaproteobacteria bacterium HGW-Betaproteobacteria-21]
MLTQTELDTLLALYEAMADAAQANAWDTLATLEREAATLRSAFRARDQSTDPDTMAALAAPEADALRSRIERILVLDGEIRAHTDPFLVSVRKLLSTDTRSRAMRNAYGALAP